MELVIRAADEVGCAVIDELMLATPLVIQQGVGLQVQVVVGAADEAGCRPVSVYSRRDQPDAEWSLHAEGTLGVPAAEASVDLSVWPPDGAENVHISDGYARLAARGYEYGPAFRGLVALWRRGPELFAEVAAPADAGVRVDGMGIHPALMDAVLHAVGLGADTADTVLPFCWRGVSLHAGGASRVRARFSALDAGAMSIDVADAAGLPVLTVRSLMTRPMTGEQLRAAVSTAAARPDREPLEVVWSPIPLKPNKIDGLGQLPVVSWEDFWAGAGGGSGAGVNGDGERVGAGRVVVWQYGSAGDVLQLRGHVVAGNAGEWHQ